MVGDHESGDPLDDATIQMLAEHPRIRHLGWVDDPRTVYPAVDILAFPSYREGLPNVPLEAQVCGVPVVGYAATGTVDAVRNGETGRLVPVGDRPALADALIALLTDDDERHRLGSAGAEWVSTTFDQQRVWNGISTLYRTWVQARQAR